jgi:hypothetical protein
MFWAAALGAGLCRNKAQPVNEQAATRTKIGNSFFMGMGTRVTRINKPNRHCMFNRRALNQNFNLLRRAKRA